MKNLIAQLNKLLFHYEYAASKSKAHKEAYKGMLDALNAVKQLVIEEQERIIKELEAAPLEGEELISVYVAIPIVKGESQ